MSESANLLRRARDQAGLTQRDLARRSGVAQPLISAYEKGRRQPGADMFLRLLRASGHEVALVSTVEASREAAAKLEQVMGIAMVLPVRDRGPLTFPSWRTLTA